jgi:hypothetical protein
MFDPGRMARDHYQADALDEVITALTYAMRDAVLSITPPASPPGPGPS